MPHDPYTALYIHIPFCASKCAYCDFHSFATSTEDAAMESYVDDLILQIKRYAQEGELANLSTIYMGGGTPTHLGHGLLTRLLYAISLYVHLDRIEEFTIEANPESLTEAMVKDIWSLGVNRLSLGVQSFDDAVLASIGRAHTALDALHAIERAKTRFANVSVDLICGLPHQTRESFLADVQRAIDAGVVHMSIYPLSVEQGTPLARSLRKGTITLPDDDEVACMLEDAQALLGQAGFSRYEVANYARPGFASVHNASYWQGHPYLGLGQSAATMTQNAERRMRVVDGEVTDDLDERQMAAEDLMLSMRMTAGADAELVARASALIPETLPVLEELEAQGLVVCRDGAWQPTERGWLCGNELYGALLDLAP